jgi:hypothetical protein
MKTIRPAPSHITLHQTTCGKNAQAIPRLVHYYRERVVLVSVKQDVHTIIAQQSPDVVMVREVVERVVDEANAQPTQRFRAISNVTLHLLFGKKDLSLLAVFSAQPR